MAIHCQSCRLSKRGNTLEEYEDAFAVDLSAGRFAVADGATEASFAATWAEILVEDFVRQPMLRPRAWRVRLAPLQERWLATVNGLSLPWYAEAKLQLGAQATFLGLVLDKSASSHQRRWRAIAVGDTCLFQIRNGRLRRCFPLQRSAQFGCTPALVGSRNLSNGHNQVATTKSQRGRLATQDTFWLMTDALAHWFLVQCETGGNPCAEIEDLLRQPAREEAFAAWVEALRDRGEIRNDDVTLVAVNWDGRRKR